MQTESIIIIPERSGIVLYRPPSEYTSVCPCVRAFVNDAISSETVWVTNLKLEHTFRILVHILICMGILYILERLGGSK